jgi:ATP-dependent DNA helicase RecG
MKPCFEIKDNSITVTLPVLSSTKSVSLDENEVLHLLGGEMRYSSSEIAKKLNWSKDKAVRIINGLVASGYAMKHGTGRGTKYSKK